MAKATDKLESTAGKTRNTVYFTEDNTKWMNYVIFHTKQNGGTINQTDMLNNALEKYFQGWEKKNGEIKL